METAFLAQGLLALREYFQGNTPAEAEIHLRDGGRVEVRFSVPQSAITPGQTCVLYDGDRVIGGAAIAHALNANAGAARREVAPIAP